jgi:flagellar biosynthesis protein FlhF
MNVKRFTARTPRDALALVRQAFGEEAIVMSTKPCAEGVEVVAMAPESIEQLERVGAQAPLVAARPAGLPPPSAPSRPPSPAREAAASGAPRAAAPALPALPARALPGERIEPTLGGVVPSVEQDVRQLEMSTLSFQDYVRERMLKRRQSELASSAAEAEEPAKPPVVSPIEAARARHAQRPVERGARPAAPAAAASHEPPVLREEVRLADVPDTPAPPAPNTIGAISAIGALSASARRAETPREQLEMLSELRSMRGLIEQRFGALAFMEKLQRQPRQAQLSQKMLDIGFSPALTKKLVESLPSDVQEITWAASVLERNLATGEREGPLEDLGGVYALIGATGVGKTTSTAKLAAAFAARHGAANLGLITLDAYRVGAQEQLRTYGRILGVPVHTAHDRASLEDLLELLAGKRMVLIDTAGMAQRDDRTRELLEMLSHPSIKRLVVLNASAQGETIEDQLAAYAKPGCRGVVLSKVDEAVKLAPALDALIRLRLPVLAVANGQRVPEDWHRLSAGALVQRALKSQSAAAWRLGGDEVNLIFAGLPTLASQQRAAMAPA